MPSIPFAESYFSLVPDRQCGECMICCEYLAINTFNFKKPADTLCQNCIVNHGCSIYNTRPTVCRTWHCLWRRHAGLAEEMRPDKSNVIFSLKVNYEPSCVFENAYIVCMALTDPSVFDTPNVAKAIDMFIKEENLPVWLSHGGSKTMIWPDEKMADAIYHPSSTTFKDLVEPGKVLRDRLNDMHEPLQVRHQRFQQRFL